jgi:hypothetical protein
LIFKQWVAAADHNIADDDDDDDAGLRQPCSSFCLPAKFFKKFVSKDCEFYDLT